MIGTGRVLAMLVRSALVALLVALTGAALPSPAPAAAAVPVPAVTVPAVTVAAEPAEPVKWYRVRPSFNGEEEFLWEISERFLGDGDRLDEIFQLNKGRLQPDGKRLTVPDEIESGWVLQLPPDAEGPGVEFSPLPVAASAAAGPVPPATTGTVGASAPEPGGSSRLPLLLGIGLLLVAAGAVLGLLLVRRRRSVPAAAAALGIPASAPARRPTCSTPPPPGPSTGPCGC